MIFNGNLIGMNLFSEAYILPISRPYQRLTFFENTIINNVWVMNRILTEEELNNIKIENSPQFNEDTIGIARFNDLNMGNIEGENDGEISKWLVMRKESKEATYKVLASLSPNITKYVDYTEETGKTYNYKIVPVFADKRGKDLFVDRITADFSSYYLIDPVDGKTFIFNLNAESGEISNQTDVTFYDNFTKYQGVIQGKQNFIKGSISAIIAENDDYSNGLNQSIYYLKEFREFVNNGRPKLFKLAKGGVYKVALTNLREGVLDEGIEDLPYTVSVDYTEIGEVD
jgi:hypothetical protein